MFHRASCVPWVVFGLFTLYFFLEFGRVGMLVFVVDIIGVRAEAWLEAFLARGLLFRLGVLPTLSGTS